MRAEEVLHLESRLQGYKKMEVRRNILRSLLTQITRSDPDGPSQQGPFTSNTRESRSVDEIKVFFSKTQGGAAETHIMLSELGISAPAFGRFLESELRKEFDDLTTRMEAI